LRTRAECTAPVVSSRVVTRSPTFTCSIGRTALRRRDRRSGDEAIGDVQDRPGLPEDLRLHVQAEDAKTRDRDDADEADDDHDLE